jgi:hypothetical protein
MTKAFAGIALLTVSIACGGRSDDSPSNRSISAAAVAQGCGEATLTDEGIGELKIGTPIDSIHAHCVVVSDTIELAEEGLPARIMRVAFDRDTVEATADSGKVWRISIESPRIRTADSLGVGTKLPRLLQLKKARGLSGEGAVFVVSPERCGLSFELSDAGSDAPPENWNRSALARLPDSTSVTRVLIVGCSRAAS